MPPRSTVRLALGALALASACTCGEPPQEGGRPAIALAPLPEAPVLDIPQEELPGGGKLAVVAARPRGEVRGNFRPVITFSRPVMALEMATASAPPPATIEPPIPGEWRWLGSASVELIPSAPVPLSTRFRVTVPAGLRSLDGGRLEEPYTFEFETPRLEVQDVTPTAGFRWLTPRSTFTVLLDQRPRDPSRIHLEVGESRRVIALRVTEERSAKPTAQQDTTTPGPLHLPVIDEIQPPGRGGARPPDFTSRQVKYTLAPVEPLPLDAPVELVVPADLASVEGPLPRAGESRFAYRTHGPLAIVRAGACVLDEEGGSCPWGPLVLHTSNPVQPAALRGKITITPDPQIDWDRAEAGGPTPWNPSRGPYVSLPGKYRPGVTYTVRLEAGVTDELGQKAPAFEEVATTDDLEPSFDAGSAVALLESSGDGALPVKAVNLARVEARLWQLSPSQMARLLDAHDRDPIGMPTAVSLDTSAARNAPRHFPLDLRGTVLGGRRSGLFFAELRAPELRHGGRTRVIGQVTDLAVHAKLGATSGVVWVTSLQGGVPVPGAALELLDREGRSRWTGTTDADGLARVPGLSELIPGDSEVHDWGTPYAMVSAEKDGDVGVTLSTWQGGLSPGAFDLPSAWDGTRARSLGVVFAERGIYRPGDEVLAKGIVRHRSLGRIRTPPAGTKVALTVTSARGDEAWSGEVVTTPFGTFSTRLRIPAEAPLGTWSIAAKLSAEGQQLDYGGWFRVEEYRAPQFQVDVSAPSRDAIAGDPLRASGLARYLFGGAMAGARVRWSAGRSSTWFTPPGNDGFLFGANVWSWDDGEPSESRDVAGGGDGVTDATGAFVVEAGKAEAPAGRTWSYVIEAEVEDVSRQRVASRVEVTVHPAAVYAGLRFAGDGFAQAGRPARMELVAVGPDGARTPGVKVGVEIRRREWKSIRKKGVGGEWYTVSEPEERRVASCDAVSAASAVPCEFTPVEPGFYVVEASASDAAGRKQVTTGSLYVIGEGWVSWQRNDTDRVDLVADRRSYGVGDTARILVKSPYPRAEAVVTVEREGVTSVRRVRFEGSANTIDVPLDTSAVPNVFVGVVLVRGRVDAAQGIESGDDPGRPAVRVGYVQLHVERREKRLSVEVKPDATEKRPRDRVAVDLQVKDAAGRGARAEVAVWAVDEAVLRLTGYQPPDPVEAIHPERGLSVRVGEPLIHLVLRRLYTEKGESAGGGGGGDAGGGFRSDFRTTILFLPEVVTDAQGRARVELDLPDNLTTFRIMAVAVTEEDRSGAGEARVTVSKPLLALPSLPRLLHVGDRAEAGVVIHGRGFAGGTVKVTATAQGLRLDGATQRTVTVQDGKPVEVRFGLAAEAAGTAVLRFAVEGGGERDGLEQKLPVVLPVSMEAVAAYGDTEGERVEGVVPPAGVRPGIGGLTVTLASTVLGGFDEGMRQLVDYPYGCLEQLSSRLVPFVALRELSGKFGVPLRGPPDEARRTFVRALLGEDTLALAGSTDPDAVVRATITRIQQLQRWDGGYGFWAGDRCSSVDGSVYAVLALSRAQEVGYEVDGPALEKGKRFVADVASGKGQRCEGASDAPAPASRAFALYALARSGSPRPSHYGGLFTARKELPLFAAAMLADAMFVGKGDRGQARTLLEEILDHAVETPAGVHFEESDDRTYSPAWSSDTRTTGIVLQTLASVSPDHPYVSKIGRYLGQVRQGTGRFRNTQEAAFALMALTEVTRTRERAAPDFIARVKLGDRSVAEATFRGRSMNVVTATIPPEKLGSGKLPLTFAREGQGVLYYGALLRYAPAELPMTPLDRGIAVQRWFEPFTGGGQARVFYAGDLVKIRVRVATSRQRDYVAVDLPLPAGLEAVDTSLATAAQVPDSGEEYGHEGAEEILPDEEEELPSPWADRFWSPFNHVERRDDRIVLFADRLPPGVHTATVVARATTPGDFVLKAAQAGEMYAPEVFGRSDGGRLQVLLPAAVAAR